MMQIPDHYPPILTEIAELLHLRLGQQLPADQASTLAMTCTEDLRAVFGGSLVYLPKGKDYERKARDADIYHAFTAGKNHLELARRYRLTVTQIYDILARVRTSKQPR